MNQDLLNKYTLSSVRPITWDEIYNKWKEREEEVWREHYTSRGYDSWDAWRGQFIEKLKSMNQKWILYKINNPLESIPQMFVGPFQGWTPYYQDRSLATFNNIAQNLDEQKRAELTKLAHNLPDKSLFFGICDHARIMTLDGTHRSTAITLAKQNKLNICPDIEIALSHFETNKQMQFNHFFDTIVQTRGSKFKQTNA